MADSSRAPARYTLSVPSPSSHLVHVALELSDVSALAESTDKTLRLKMASWCPGSYLVRDYARYVRDLEVVDQDGEPLLARKISKCEWAIDIGGASGVTVRYAVYGLDLSVRTNHIDETHAFLHGPATYLYVESLRQQPSDVFVKLPPDHPWSIATGLKPHPSETSTDVATYLATDLDNLLDCPLHLGTTEDRSFEVGGTRFELFVWGQVARGIRTLDDLVSDLKGIVAAHAERFEGFPFNSYTFILMLSPGSYGGLEHKNSSANLASSTALTREKTYYELLELLSHEFFHVWNGKRIFPASFQPFDYDRENYTSGLWVMEGLTSYYDRYTVLRSGPLPVEMYFEKLAQEWARLLSTPGRSRQSLQASSFDAWIKLYKPDPSNLNTTVSYYLKGGLVATALDLWIRRHSNGQKSLENVLTALWKQFGIANLGYPEDVESIFTEAVGLDLSEPFARWIVGTEDPDLPTELQHVGLSLMGTNEPDTDPTYLGIQTSERPLRVSAVLDDSPAARAPLSPGDEIIAIDGIKVGTAAGLRQRLEPTRPGDKLKLTVFRRRTLTHVELKLAACPPKVFQISTREDASDDEKQRFTRWLGVPWPSDPLVVGATINRWT